MHGDEPHLGLWAPPFWMHSVQRVAFPRTRNTYRKSRHCHSRIEARAGGPWPPFETRVMALSTCHGFLVRLHFPLESNPVLAAWLAARSSGARYWSGD